jgi:uncharacterized cupin superfamily protein
VSNDFCQQLADDGFAGPVPILSAEECRRFVGVLDRPDQPPPLDWTKGCAATLRAYYELATHPRVMAIVQAALGDHVLLFSACALAQPPGAAHPWHSDIETSGTAGRTLSVWIGLENVAADSALQFISRSHRFGQTLQQVRGRAGKTRGDVSTEDAIAWAKAIDANAAHVTPAAAVGHALLFQGQSWHHSNNRTDKVRRSVLLQFATPDVPVRIPDPNHLDWPFRYREHPRPPCILLRGSDDAGVNRIVTAPVRASTSKVAKYQLTDQLFAPSLPLPTDERTGFKYYKMFSGATPDVREMEVHTSALAHGQSPHPPHTHREEELLIMLAGEAELILPALNGAAPIRLRPGGLVYYPAHFPHTLRTTSPTRANYLMFKWDNDPRPAGSIQSQPSLAFQHHCASESGAAANDAETVESRTRSRKLFHGPTACLRALHCHVSTVPAGRGYEPHADAYDVAIVVLEGEIESLGQRVGPGATIFHAAGQPHGLRNPCTIPARYLVFEFHGSQASQPEAFPGEPLRTEPSLLDKVRDPQRWKRKLKRVATRLRG